MKYLYRMMLMTVFFLSLLSSVSASEYVTETVDEEMEAHIREINDLQLLTTEPTKDVIRCFDVDTRGWIALGFQRGDKKTVCVYNDYMEFQYGYTFTYSPAFGIAWDEHHVVIHYVRSDLGKVYDENGTLLEIYQIPNDATNSEHWDRVLHDTKRVVGACTYECRNDGFFQALFNNGYNRLYVADAKGNRSLLYDAEEAGTANAWRTVTWISGGLLFAGINTLIIVSNVKQAKKKANEKAAESKE